jgi:hypothetical protein
LVSVMPRARERKPLSQTSADLFREVLKKGRPSVDSEFGLNFVSTQFRGSPPQAVRLVEGQVKARGGRRINARADDPAERPQSDREVPERPILQIQQAACPSAYLTLL